MNFKSTRRGPLALSAVAALGFATANVAVAGPVSAALATPKTIAVPVAPTRNFTSTESARLASPLPRPRPRPPVCPKEMPCIPPLL
jgi:hypothetical protein